MAVGWNAAAGCGSGVPAGPGTVTSEAPGNDRAVPWPRCSVLRRLVGDPAAGDGQEHPAAELPSEEGRVLALREQRASRHLPRRGTIEHDEVGRLAFDQPAPITSGRTIPQDPGRTGR